MPKANSQLTKSQQPITQNPSTKNMKQFIPIIILFIVIIIIALASSLLSRPGAPPKIQPLSIGDELPEIKAVASMGENHTPLTWPKDKLLILEFISTHCSTCVRSIDQLQALQAQFANELEIILQNGVTNSGYRTAQVNSNKYNCNYIYITSTR